jgi:hypothetical protein
MADDRNRFDDMDYGRDYGSGRDYTYSSARDYAAAGRLDRDDRNFRGGGQGYAGGPFRGDGRERYGARDYYGGRGGYGTERYGRDDSRSGRFDEGRASGGEYRGSYAHDGHRFTEAGDRDGGRERAGPGGPPRNYRHEDRGFFDRAGDEVRSWFGDDDAERRRELDQRHDESTQPQRGYDHHDANYHAWRRTQVQALDRDYDEYRRENAGRFESEFGSWRNERQTQRTALSRVAEHMEVVGSDGQHVGTVDKVRGDRILLTKNDVDAGGRHHSIPSRWIEHVDDKVTIRKTADEAKSHWRDEERSGALFGDEPRRTATTRDAADEGRVDLNRSFPGTY